MAELNHYVIAADKSHFDRWKKMMIRDARIKKRPGNERKANAAVLVKTEADLRLAANKHPVILVGPFWRHPQWEFFLSTICRLCHGRNVALQWFPAADGAEAVINTGDLSRVIVPPGFKA